MLSSDPRDRIVYLIHKVIIDSYNPNSFIMFEHCDYMPLIYGTKNSSMETIFYSLLVN